MTIVEELNNIGITDYISNSEKAINSVAWELDFCYTMDVR